MTEGILSGNLARIDESAGFRGQIVPVLRPRPYSSPCFFPPFCPGRTIRRHRWIKRGEKAWGLARSGDGARPRDCHAEPNRSSARRPLSGGPARRLRGGWTSARRRARVPAARAASARDAGDADRDLAGRSALRLRVGDPVRGRGDDERRHGPALLAPGPPVSPPPP